MKSIPEVSGVLANDRIVNPGKVSSKQLGKAAVKFGMAKMIENIRVGKLIDAEVQHQRYREGQAGKNEP